MERWPGPRRRKPFDSKDLRRWAVLLKVVCETMDNYEKEGKHEKLGQVSLLAGVEANPH
jgi:hypothetical protein